MSEIVFGLPSLELAKSIKQGIDRFFDMAGVITPTSQP
jgi:hypothetical protein